MRELTVSIVRTLAILALVLLLAVCICLSLVVAAHPAVVSCACALGTIAGFLWTRRTLRRLRRERRVRKAQCSPLAETLTPLLQGSFSPYVIEAAEKLGEARDASAVPALIAALERCVETQPPGWSDQAAALANSLARIGDRRALALLYRLDNVRGIGLIPAVRNAIAAIEPQTSLLRAGSQYDLTPHLLLRSAHHQADANDTAVLLRSADSAP